MNWVDGRIGPCASCDRIKPLRAIAGTPVCADCANECTRLLETTANAGAVATDGGSSRRVPCPECDHGELLVSDGVYAECDTCDAAVQRTEAGI